MPDEQIEVVVVSLEEADHEVAESLDFALVRFRGSAALKTFVAARDRGADPRWIRGVGLVEHHHNGHIVSRGAFAGHYIDVDEALHLSEKAAAEGFAAGALRGALLGPPGLAFRMVLSWSEHRSGRSTAPCPPRTRGVPPTGSLTCGAR